MIPLKDNEESEKSNNTQYLFPDNNSISSQDIIVIINNLKQFSEVGIRNYSYKKI